MDDRIAVGVLGATGTVGQKLVQLLDGHPWFRLAEVGASASSAGQTLGKRVPGGALPTEAAALPLGAPDSEWESPILLSALPSGAARDLEIRLAEAGHLVVSNASAHRMRHDVPLLIPEVNADHLEMVESQPWDGAVVTNPNCAVAGLGAGAGAPERRFRHRACGHHVPPGHLRGRHAGTPRPEAFWTTSCPSSREKRRSWPRSPRRSWGA